MDGHYLAIQIAPWMLPLRAHLLAPYFHCMHTASPCKKQVAEERRPETTCMVFMQYRRSSMSYESMAIYGCYVHGKKPRLHLGCSQNSPQFAPRHACCNLICWLGFGVCQPKGRNTNRTSHARTSCAKYVSCPDVTAKKWKVINENKNTVSLTVRTCPHAATSEQFANQKVFRFPSKANSASAELPPKVADALKCKHILHPITWWIMSFFSFWGGHLVC